MAPDESNAAEEEHILTEQNVALWKYVREASSKKEEKKRTEEKATENGISAEEVRQRIDAVKGRIRNLVMAQPEKQRKAFREQLARTLGVSVPTISALGAWGTDSLKQKRKSSQGTAEQKTATNSKEPGSVLSLQERDVLRRHVTHGLAIGRPTEQLRSEAFSIFTQRFSPEILEREVRFIKESIGEETHEVLTEQTIVSKGEWVNYDNPIKTESRDWWLQKMWNGIADEPKADRRRIFMPGPECYELEPVIAMGVPPKMIRTYIRGEEPEANAVHIRNCQDAGVTGWTVGDMRENLPKETKPFWGGNLDFFGQYAGQVEEVLQKIPLPENGKVHFNVNVLSKREPKRVAENFHRLGGMWRSTERVKSVQTFREYIDTLASIQMDVQREPAPMKEDRPIALILEIEENLGVADQKQWICPELLHELGTCIGEHPRWETYDTSKQYKIIRDNMEKAIQQFPLLLEDAFMKREDIHPFFRVVTSFTTHSLLFNGVFARNRIVESDQHTYVSPEGNNPFISNFVTIERRRDEFLKMQKTIEFLLKVAIHFLKHTEKLRQNPLLQSMDMHSVPAGAFRILGEGDNAMLVYQDMASFLVQELHKADEDLQSFEDTQLKNSYTEPVYVERGQEYKDDETGPSEHVVYAIPLSMFHADITRYADTFDAEHGQEHDYAHPMWKSDDETYTPPLKITIHCTHKDGEDLRAISRGEFIELMKPHIDAFLTEHPDRTEVNIMWAGKEFRKYAQETNFDLKTAAGKYAELDVPDKLKERIFGKKPTRKNPKHKKRKKHKMPPLEQGRQKVRIGRNDPCPCDSGSKFKNCCMRRHED